MHFTAVYVDDIELIVTLTNILMRLDIYLNNNILVERRKCLETGGFNRIMKVKGIFYVEIP